MFIRGATDEETAFDMNIDNRFEFVFVDIEKCSVADDSRIVDDNVELAEFFQRVSDHRVSTGTRGHRIAICSRYPTGGPDCFNNCFRWAWVVVLASHSW